MTLDETISHLIHLTRINLDAEAGFRTAAGNTRNSELETLFGGYANQHARFVTELQEETTRLGGSFADSGTLDGAVHRGWMDLKSALSGHSAAGILSSCESAEESAEISYGDVLAANLTGQTNKILTKHVQQIKEFRTRLCRLIGETKDGLDFQSNE